MRQHLRRTSLVCDSFMSITVLGILQVCLHPYYVTMCHYTHFGQTTCCAYGEIKTVIFYITIPGEQCNLKIDIKF